MCMLAQINLFLPISPSLKTIESNATYINPNDKTQVSNQAQSLKSKKFDI